MSSAGRGVRPAGIRAPDQKAGVRRLGYGPGPDSWEKMATPLTIYRLYTNAGESSQQLERKLSGRACGGK